MQGLELAHVAKVKQCRLGVAIDPDERVVLGQPEAAERADERRQAAAAERYPLDLQVVVVDQRGQRAKFVLQRRVAASKARDTMTMMRCCRARLAQRDLGARRDAREQRVATIHSIGLSVLVDQP